MSEDDDEKPASPVHSSIKATDLDDIIDRLINYDKYTGYTISETKTGNANDSSMPLDS